MSTRPPDPAQLVASQLAPPREGVAPVIRRIFGFTLPYWRRLLAASLAFVLSAAFIVAMPQLVQWAIDNGLGVTVVDGDFAVDVDQTLLVVAALAILGAAVLRGLLQFGQSYLSEWVAQQVAYDIRNRLYQRLQTLSFAYHDKAETGQIMSRATQDVEVVRMFLNFGGLRLVFMIGLLVTVLVLMMITDWQLGLIGWGFMVLILWRGVTVARRLRPVWLEVQEGQARLGTVLQEALTGIRVVKAFSREAYEGEKFGREAQWLYERSFVSSRIQAINSPLMDTLWMGAMAATIWLGGIRVAEGDLSLGALSALLLYLTLLQMPVRSLGWMITMVPRAASAGSRIFEVLDQESDVQQRPGAVPLVTPRGAIRFDRVSFAYSERSPVLRDVSFTVEPGQVVALLGPTGSGKTTVVNLISRFYDVSAGAITFDGIDLRTLQLDSLRRQVAVVQQDIFLFAATIRDNIAYGRSDATDEEIEAAAKVARIHDYIASQPGGYDTWVGERGVTLSGGQQQRFAIARALLTDPRVLILDDSTSSVDTRTEAEIQEALALLTEGRTTFVIAHRLRTAREADQILVLEQGHIVERGVHAELLARDGAYRRIYNAELRDQEEALGVAAGGS